MTYRSSSISQIPYNPAAVLPTEGFKPVISKGNMDRAKHTYGMVYGSMDEQKSRKDPRPIAQVCGGRLGENFKSKLQSKIKLMSGIMIMMKIELKSRKNCARSFEKLQSSGAFSRIVVFEKNRNIFIKIAGLLAIY